MKTHNYSEIKQQLNHLHTAIMKKKTNPSFQTFVMKDYEDCIKLFKKLNSQNKYTLYKFAKQKQENNFSHEFRINLYSLHLLGIFEYAFDTDSEVEEVLTEKQKQAMKHKIELLRKSINKRKNFLENLRTQFELNIR